MSQIQDSTKMPTGHNRERCICRPVWSFPMFQQRIYLDLICVSIQTEHCFSIGWMDGKDDKSGKDAGR